MTMKEKIAVIRKSYAEKNEKASELDILIAGIMKLPYGQLKKVLSEEVLAVLAKYGYTENTN